MPILTTTYRIYGGPERRAQVAQPVSRPRRSTLRDRIKRLHLDAIDPSMAGAFDGLQAKMRERVYVGVDLSTKPDITAVWVWVA